MIARAGEVKTAACSMMTDTPFPALAEDYAAALDWWREAGVDADFLDEPSGWLIEPEADDAVTAPPPPAPPPVQRKTPLQRATGRIAPAE